MHFEALFTPFIQNFGRFVSAEVAEKSKSCGTESNDFLNGNVGAYKNGNL